MCSLRRINSAADSAIQPDNVDPHPPFVPDFQSILRIWLAQMRAIRSAGGGMRRCGMRITGRNLSSINKFCCVARRGAMPCNNIKNIICESRAIMEGRLSTG